jgi:hypothetical protein
MAASLEDLRVLVDSREDDQISSWATGLTYGEVLSHSRASVPAGRHVVTLQDYLQIWLTTVVNDPVPVCNQSSHWMRRAAELEPDTPMAFLRHPFQSTILVDTYLDELSSTPSGEFEGLVYVGGLAAERVRIPPTGKIYELGPYGLPTSTGGHKNDRSVVFEHRWWAFSSEQARLVDGQMALFANGGTIGCFCELIKAHYYLGDRGGYYRVLSIPD